MEFTLSTWFGEYVSVFLAFIGCVILLLITALLVWGIKRLFYDYERDQRRIDQNFELEKQKNVLQDLRIREQKAERLAKEQEQISQK